MFADVYVAYPIEGVFTYGIPHGMNVKRGCRVKVNFAGREVVAFIAELHDNEPENFDVKDIIELIDNDPIYDERLINTAAYTASAYLATIGETLSMALPSGLKPSSGYALPFEENGMNEFRLSDDQKALFEEIKKGYEDGKNYHLLFGVTGSGKTEIYIETAKYFIETDRSVIYLVPEISLSSQIFQRLYRVFGNELIIYHSHLTAGERLHNWIRFYNGDAKVAVGTRSAVFLQCPRLGAIVIDEEHDSSYKENSTPRYNARRIAFYRGKLENCLVLMGSATPSVESLFASEKGKIVLHRFDKRYGNADLPEIKIVKINSGNEHDSISSLLRLYTKREIDKGNQAIFLLNRRGFSPFVICGSCGETLQCPDCSISLNYHSSGKMVCHYCGLRMNIPLKCAICGSDNLTKLGSGTQRIEEYINKYYKDFRVFRLDRDSARRKGVVYDLMKDMKEGNIDLLIGTQMVAKGFDFPGVTVVGILLADIGLHIPDFRASERIFSLLIQVAGRCGRGEKPGLVILQTLNDENLIYRFIEKHDYMGFYRWELSVRESLGYPPFTRLARLLVRGKDEKRVINSINELKKSIDKNILPLGNRVKILGPAGAPLTKIAKNYRYHIILKSRDRDLLREVISSSRNAVTSKNVYLEIDIDPYDML